MLAFVLFLCFFICRYSATEHRSYHVCGVRPFMHQEPQPYRLHERTKRVIGGEGAGVGEFPWQVSLGTISPPGDFEPFCGGTLVHASWIVTAAHCLIMFDSDITKKDKNITVRLGMTDDYHSTPYLDAQLSERIVHEGFALYLWGQKDIALLKLTEPIPFSPYISPICIAPYKNYTGSIGTLTGWGALFEGGPRPHVLQKTRVPFISNVDCQQWFSEINGVLITPDLICTMDRNGGRGACAADSGSPVVQEMDGRWVLVGIVSRSHLSSCEGPYFTGPTVYGFVPVFADWIRKKTDGEVCLPDFRKENYGTDLQNVYGKSY